MCSMREFFSVLLSFLLFSVLLLLLLYIFLYCCLSLDGIFFHTLFLVFTSANSLSKS